MCSRSCAFASESASACTHVGEHVHACLHMCVCARDLFLGMLHFGGLPSGCAGPDLARGGMWNSDNPLKYESTYVNLTSKQT